MVTKSKHLYISFFRRKGMAGILVPKDMRDFGTLKHPNLETLTKVLDQALPTYAAMLGEGVTFERKDPLTRAPAKKAYTASTVVPVTYHGREEGTLYAILFCPGDGTGDGKSIPIGNVHVPPEYHFDYWDKPERVVPRSKGHFSGQKRTIIEACLPFYSVLQNTVQPEGEIIDLPNGGVVPFTISLEELGLDHGTIIKLWDLGMDQTRYQDREIPVHRANPHIYLTVGTSHTGHRFGDPHAIYAGRHLKTMQMAGFLGVTDPHNPLAKMIEKVGIAPYA
jgi:hypothetical protein